MELQPLRSACCCNDGCLDTYSVMELQHTALIIRELQSCLDTYSVMELQPNTTWSSVRTRCLDTYSVMELQRVKSFHAACSKLFRYLFCNGITTSGA